MSERGLVRGPEASVLHENHPLGAVKISCEVQEKTGSPQRREEEGRRGKGLGKGLGGKQGRAGTGSKGRRRARERKQALLVVGWWLH